MRSLVLVGLLLSACGRAVPVPAPAALPPSQSLPNPLWSATDPRLPVLGIGNYWLVFNRGELHNQEDPTSLPIPGVDFDGTQPGVPIALRAVAPAGIALTYRGAAPVVGTGAENGRETNVGLMHDVPATLGTTTLQNIGVHGHGLYQVSVDAWIRGDGDPRPCWHPHRWIGVVIPPMNPLAPRESRDVVYQGTGGDCGGMYMFDATGPSVGWIPGQPLTIDWRHLVDVIHARGFWPETQAATLLQAVEHVEIAGFNTRPGAVTGGATVVFSDWTDGP